MVCTYHVLPCLHAISFPDSRTGTAWAWDYWPGIIGEKNKKNKKQNEVSKSEIWFEDKGK